MTEVYLVETGEYSDRTIRFVTLDKQKADDWVELHNSLQNGFWNDARVHTHELDKTANYGYDDDEDMFAVRFDPRSGYVYMDKMWAPWKEDPEPEVTGPVDVIRCSAEDGVLVVGKDEDLVKKVARDRINRIKAEIAGVA